MAVRRIALPDPNLAEGSVMMTARSYPFVYIAGLQRSGSTLVAELLSGLPDAFIILVPKLALGRFFERNSRQLLDVGIDVEPFRERWAGTSLRSATRRRLAHGSLVGAFRRELLPDLQARIRQVGVKEIRHAGWRRYVDELPDLRAVVTVRDPRDIYLSIAERHASGAGWHRDLSPESVAERIGAEAAYQVQILESVPAIGVRYEDVCTDPAMVDRIRRAVDSPLAGGPLVGAFLATKEDRQSEHELHGDSVTTRRVERWREEPDVRLRADAMRCAELLGDFCERWGYES
jgi:hypothetical protein